MATRASSLCHKPQPRNADCADESVPPDRPLPAGLPLGDPPTHSSPSEVLSRINPEGASSIISHGAFTRSMGLARSAASKANHGGPFRQAQPRKRSIPCKRLDGGEAHLTPGVAPSSRRPRGVLVVAFPALEFPTITGANPPSLAWAKGSPLPMSTYRGSRAEDAPRPRYKALYSGLNLTGLTIQVIGQE